MSNYIQESARSIVKIRSVRTFESKVQTVPVQTSYGDFVHVPVRYRVTEAEILASTTLESGKVYTLFEKLNDPYFRPQEPGIEGKRHGLVSRAIPTRHGRMFILNKLSKLPTENYAD